MLLLVILSLSIGGIAQPTILGHPDIQDNIRQCLYAAYGVKPKEATDILKLIEKQLPDHPAPVFLKAMILYWEYFPIPPEDKKAEEFIGLLDRVIHLSSIMLDQNPEHLEGLFFDLHARALKAMYWADNGKSAKVLKDIDNLYRVTMKSILLKENFNELYFSSGLYNYYIEAYIEKHPVYTPVAYFCRKGDRELGLKELDYAAEHTVFIQFESLLFLTLIYLNYEDDLPTAINYCSILYNYFPENIHFTALYLILLLHSENYTVASVISEGINPGKSDFHRMVRKMAEAFILENSSRKYASAKNSYSYVLSEAEKYGHVANTYAAVAYAGLSRIAERENDPKLAKTYSRKSESYSNYEFILEF